MKYEEGNYQSSSASWLLSFVLGGLVGAAVALLWAPKSGRQTREQIKDIAQDAKGKAEDYYGHVREKVSTAMQKGSEMFQEKKPEGQPTAEQGKGA
jgi:gas vesicle protein